MLITLVDTVDNWFAAAFLGLYGCSQVVRSHRVKSNRPVDKNNCHFVCPQGTPSYPQKKLLIHLTIHRLIHKGAYRREFGLFSLHVAAA